MSHFRWSTRYELGRDDMDATHREFIDLVNAAAIATDEKLETRFQELLIHTREHFEAENRLMETSGFPPIQIHQGEHRRVLDAFEQAAEGLEAGNPRLARDLLGQLPTWFDQHSATMDNALASHIRVVEAAA